MQEDGEVVKKNMVNERLPEAEIPATGDPTNIALFATIMSVSYTHLDVYKRQPEKKEFR